MRLSGSWVIPACVVAVLLAGCTAGAPGRPEPSALPATLEWSRTTLPDGARPSLVAPGPHGSVLVAVDGDALGSEPPRLLRVGRAGARSVPVRATTYYGRRVVWRGLVAAGPAISAFGGRSGGAHGNVRWSAWSGRSGLREELQPFETFGGPKAGGIAGIAVTAGGRPVLVGSHVSAQGAGLDVALWTHRGSRWLRSDSGGTALAAGPDLQPSAHAVLGRRTGLVVVGSVTELADTPRTVPAAWTARTAAGPWTRLELSGARRPVAEALSGACHVDGACLLVGSDGGRLVGWQISSDGQVSAVDLPHLTIASDDLAVAAVRRREFAVALATASGGRVLVGDAGRWASAPGPPGAVTSSAVAGQRLWTVTVDDGRTGLWSAPIS